MLMRAMQPITAGGLISQVKPPTAVVKYYFTGTHPRFLFFLTAIPLAFYELRWAQYYLFILFPIHGDTRKYFSYEAG